jgi:hypothetical protein
VPILKTAAVGVALLTRPLLSFHVVLTVAAEIEFESAPSNHNTQLPMLLGLKPEMLLDVPSISGIVLLKQNIAET